jgi:hypothetical protein
VKSTFIIILFLFSKCSSSDATEAAQSIRYVESLRKGFPEVNVQNDKPGPFSKPGQLIPLANREISHSTGIENLNGNHVTINQIRSEAERINITDINTAIVYISYIKDPDKSIRWFALDVLFLNSLIVLTPTELNRILWAEIGEEDMMLYGLIVDQVINRWQER